MLKSGKDSIIFYFMPSVVVLFIIGLAVDSLNILFISTMIVYVFMVLYAYDKQDATMLLGFLITFFVYLLGQYFTLWLSGEVWYDKFEKPVMIVIMKCLFLSLVSVFVGFVFSRKKSKGSKMSLESSYTQYAESNIFIKKISCTLFYITIIFDIIVNLEPAIFVQQGTYLDLYTDYTSQLPTVVHKIAQSNKLLFCVYLTTLPSKKELKLPCALYIMSNFITLFSGVRGTIVNCVIFVFLYYLYRQRMSKKMGMGEIWITNRLKVIIAVAIPFCIVFLSLYNSIRNGVEAEYNGFFNEILAFFENHGGSVNVIGYAESLKDRFPKTNTSYLFGPVINLFKYGFWGQLFGGGEIIKNNTLKMAMYGNNLGATVTYLVSPEKWLAGMGLGTQYIAEAYVDFGYIGVILFNIFLGYIIFKINFVVTDKWYINALFVNIILSILRMPRNFGMNFVAEMVSVFNWAVLFVVWSINYIAVKHRGTGRDKL